MSAPLAWLNAALARVALCCSMSVIALPAVIGAQRSPLGSDEVAGPVAVPSGISRERPTMMRSETNSANRLPVGACTTATTCHVERETPSAKKREDWWAPIASAAVPGAGQARLGQDRFVGYMAVEGFLWIRYLADRRAGSDARNAYRDLALRVSRATFGGPKPQGNFEYYERMEHWIASGAYDSDPGIGFSPESDTTTFNGKMWSIARKTYWSDPRTPPPVGSAAYVAALRFYTQNAVSAEFQWSWRDAPLHQDVYRRSVRASNDGFRHAAQDIGAVIANHVLSTVDAYISLRLRLHDTNNGGESGVSVAATLPFKTIDGIFHGSARPSRSR